MLGALEDAELVGKFGKVIDCAKQRGKSLAMEELAKADLLKKPLVEVPGYERESYGQLMAAMGELKSLELPMISMLERDQDHPIDVIMKGLTLARHSADGAQDTADFYLKPDVSQLHIPVFAQPRDRLNPFLLEKEIPLQEVMDKHAARLAKKKGIQGKAIMCGIGAAHQPRSDGVPVSVATVALTDAEMLSRISEAAPSTVGSSGSSLRRVKSI